MSEQPATYNPILEAFDVAGQTLAEIEARQDSAAAEIKELREWVTALLEAPNRRPLLTKQQAAEYLNCSITTIYELMARGELPVVRFDNRPRFRVADLDAWIESRIESHDA